MENITREEAAQRAGAFARQLIESADLRDMNTEELFTAFAEIAASIDPNLAGKILVALNQVVMSRLIVPAMRSEDAKEEEKPAQ